MHFFLMKSRSNRANALQAAITSCSVWFTVSCVVLSVAPTALAAPASLDNAFSGDGKFISATGVASSVANAAANYPGGKLVMAGRCETNSGDQDFCVWRLNRNGTLDNSFSGNGSQIFNMNGTADVANAIAVYQDGRIVVAGTCTPGGQRDFCVARLLANGNLDPSFDGNGRLSTEIDGDDEAVAVAARRDGKIVVAGTCKQGANDSKFCVVRYENDGSLDATFAIAGKRILDPFGQGGTASAVLSQVDNRVIVAGTCKETSAGNNRFCVARFYASGNPDDTFGGNNGKRAIDVLANSVQSLQAAALQPDGKIVLAGTCVVSSIRLPCVVRLMSDGSDDTSFDGDARAILLNYAADSYITSVSVQPDGKIVIAGYCSDGGQFKYCWDRLHPDGSRDDSVGTTRVVTEVGTTADTVSAVITTPEGGIAMAGSCRRSSGTTSDVCAARYEGGPFGYRNCKLDIDGDGVLYGTVDSLIAARLAAGVRTSALVNNLSFPTLATRTTWTEIRDYLVNQCGLSLVP